jgi:hypothetical protein
MGPGIACPFEISGRAADMTNLRSQMAVNILLRQRQERERVGLVDSMATDHPPPLWLRCRRLGVAVGHHRR